MIRSHQPLGLPDEILINIISYLDIVSLATAALVSKHFDDLVEPFLYRDQKILRGCHALALSNAIKNKPERTRWVDSLMVSTKFGDDKGLETLPTCLRRMSNLRTLTLETPDCNRRPSTDRISWINLQDRYERVFEESSILAPVPRARLLPRLERCTLHFVDHRTELYSLTKYPSLFLHPTLKSLTISCSSTDFLDRYPEHIRSDESLRHATALEHLHLEECDIEAETLAMILSFPRTLKSLKISEGIRYDTGFRIGSSRLHGNIKPPQLMEALTLACAENLESLSLSLGFRRISRDSILHSGKYLRMITLEKLIHLEVDIKTLDLLRSYPDCDHNTHRRMPPNIQTIKVFGILLGPHNIFQAKSVPNIPLQSCLIREKAKHGVPNLQTLIYEFEHYDDTDELEYDLPELLAAENNIAQQQRRRANLPGALFPDAGAAALLNDPNLAALINNPNFLAGLGNQPAALRVLVRNAVLRSNLVSNEHTREFTRTQYSLMALLDLLNQEALPHHREANILLRVDLRLLPHGFIPPYLSTEDKPVITEGWWTSESPRDTEDYKAELSLALKAKSFERGLIAERNRQRLTHETDEEEDSEDDQYEQQNAGDSDLGMDDDVYTNVLSVQPLRQSHEDDDEGADGEDDSDDSLYVDAEA